MKQRNFISKVVILLFAHLTLTPALASQSLDSDNDGVPDELDKCPNTRAMSAVPPDFKYRHAVTQERLNNKGKTWPVDSSGCELDNDNDGVINSQDYCPDDSPEAISMGVASNGCPKHSDFDGTPDYRDRCPGTPRGVATDNSGCPR